MVCVSCLRILKISLVSGIPDRHHLSQTHEICNVTLPHGNLVHESALCAPQTKEFILRHEGKHEVREARKDSGAAADKVKGAQFENPMLDSSSGNPMMVAEVLED